MKRLGPVAVLLLLSLLLPARTAADPTLTSLVNATFMVHTESATLHQIAHERVAYQVAYSGGICADGNMTHEGNTTNEVLACNTLLTGSMERAVLQWVESAPHNAILSDANLPLIGCAASERQPDDSVFYACALTGSTVIPQPTPAPQPSNPPAPIEQIVPTPQPTVQSPVITLLPNTAMRTPCQMSTTQRPSLNRTSSPFSMTTVR